MKIKANKKKIIVLVSMILLLAVTGLLNYYLNARQPAAPDEPDTVMTFFMSYRTDRELTRNQEMTYLDSLIISPQSTEDVVAAAQYKKLALCDAMETELVLESLIKAKGFEDCVVTISTENVNVIVKSNGAEFGIAPEDSAKILNIIVTETSFTAPNVIITPY